MAKRSSLFSAKAPLAEASGEDEQKMAARVESPASEPDKGRRYPIAKSREGKRVATVYLEHEALRQLQLIAFQEETTIQALLAEGVNAVFAARNMSRRA